VFQYLEESAHTVHLYHCNIQLFSLCCHKGFCCRIWTVYWWVRGHHKLCIKGKSKLFFVHTTTADMGGGGEHHSHQHETDKWLASTPSHLLTLRNDTWYPLW